MKAPKRQAAKVLFDLLHSVPRDEIMAKCAEMRPSDAKKVSVALTRLLKMKPCATTDYVLKAKVIVCDGETFHEVSCVQPSLPAIMPLSLPWREWLAARVPKSVRRMYPPDVLLAHVLRGMTRLGFSPTHIKRTEAKIARKFRTMTTAELVPDFEAAKGAEPVGTRVGARRIVCTPTFLEDLSNVPPKEQKAIKRSIARIDCRLRG